MQDDVRQLLAAIKEKADAEKAELRARAKKEIVKINERTEAQITQFQDEELAKLENQLRLESESIVGKVELEMRDRFIQAKNEILTDVFKLAGEKITALYDSKEYKEILKRLIIEALDRTNSEDVRIRLPRTEQSLWESLKENLKASISVVFCEVPKGTIIAESNDGLQSVDNSISSRLDMARGVMELELAELLFGSETIGEKGR